MADRPPDRSMFVQRLAAPIRAQVTDNLRQAIREMRFKPGQRLIERELVEMTGVSRTSIREALRELSAEGLVTTIPNKGTIVAGVTREEATQIYELRASLEGLAGRLFVERATAAQVRALRRAFEVIQRTSADGHDILAAKDRFYEILFRGAGNQPLRSVVEGLHARVTVLRATSLGQAGRPAESVEEIRAIVDAIEAGDGDAAAAAAAHHVASAARVALDALPSAASADGHHGA